VQEGGPSHTILVTDIPGIRAGTVLDTICRVRPALLHVTPAQPALRRSHARAMPQGAGAALHVGSGTC
jgi:hypothetical protein